MARRKKEVVDQAEQIQNIELSNSTERTVVLWKATRPLTVQEHEELSAKLKIEGEKTGLTIMLVPFSVEVGIE